MSQAVDYKKVYDILLEQHGHQQWWPADSAFEVMVGAILTQNTAWTNVEKAMDNLKQAGALTLEQLCQVELEQLANWIRPSGYYNLKAKRLQAFCHWLNERGGIDALAGIDTGELRNQLLSVYGVGPETADDMLLYALDRPVFVIDAYTRRLFSRLGLVNGDEKYEELRGSFERDLGEGVRLYREYHALIVNHGKYVCQKHPQCHSCSLLPYCKTGAGL